MKQFIISSLLLLTLSASAKRSESLEIEFQNEPIVLNFLQNFKDDLGRVLDFEVYENSVSVFLHNDDDNPKSYAYKLFTNTAQLYQFLGYVIQVKNNLPRRNGGEYIELYYEAAEPEGNYFQDFETGVYWQNATLTEALTGQLNDKDLYTKMEILNK